MKHFSLHKSLLTLLLVGGILLTALTPLPQPAVVAPTQKAQKETVPNQTPEPVDPAAPETPSDTNEEDALILQEDESLENEFIEEKYVRESDPNGERLVYFFSEDEYFDWANTILSNPVNFPPNTLPTVKGREALRQLMKEQLALQNHTGQTVQLFDRTLDALYDNYDSWMHRYQDMPDKDTFIREYLIAPIQYIDRVIHYSEDDPTVDLAGTYLYSEEDGGEIQVAGDDPEIFFHEVIHAHDVPFCFGNNSGLGGELDMLLSEGSTTFHQRFVAPYTDDVGGSWGLSPKNLGIEISYIKENCVGYLLYLCQFEKLVMLAGHENINAILQCNPQVDLLTVLAERCGREEATRLLRQIIYLINYYDADESAWKQEKTGLAAIAVERAFADCVRGMIQRADTPEELETISRLWVEYVKKGQPSVACTVSSEEEALQLLKRINNAYIAYLSDEATIPSEITLSWNQEQGIAYTLFDIASVDETIDQRLRQLRDAG